MIELNFRKEDLKRLSWFHRKMRPAFLSISFSVLSFCLGQEWLIGAER